MALLFSLLDLHPMVINMWFDLIIGSVGIVGIVWTLWRRSVKAAENWQALQILLRSVTETGSLVDHELNHNSGTSIKDKTYEAVELAAMALREAKRAADSIEEVKKEVLLTRQTNETVHRAMWDAITRGNHDGKPVEPTS